MFDMDIAAFIIGILIFFLFILPLWGIWIRIFPRKISSVRHDLVRNRTDKRLL